MSVYYCFSNFYQYYEKIKYQKFMKLVKKNEKQTQNKTLYRGGAGFIFKMERTL